jgi:hypothetical protein
MHRILVCLAFALAVCSAACGRPFDVKTPTGFVELDDQSPAYDYRATTPDGVVTAVRALDVNGAGTLDFWTRAVTLRMRSVSGYALIDSSDVSSADGTPGRRLRFGHDQDGKPYRYDVTVFFTSSRLFLLEAGGSREQMAALEPTFAWQAKTFRARCGSFVAPVLASRTCNRW